MTLYVEAEHEVIARKTLDRLRLGGPEFRIELAKLLKLYAPCDTATAMKKVD